MELFGWNLSRAKKQEEAEQKQQERTFIAPHEDDGAIEVESYVGTNPGVTEGGVVVSNAYNITEGAIDSDHYQRILKYRQMSGNPECDEAVKNIANDAIIVDGELSSVELRLDSVQLSDNIKEKIQDEFKYFLRLIDFKNRGYDYFREWYIDGIINFQMIPYKNINKGIAEVRRIDPLHLRKVREIKRERDNKQNVEIIKEIREYYVYKNHRPKVGQTMLVQLHPDSVISVTSGLFDNKRRGIIGHLHKAIKPLNNLISVENSAVIYRLARAPERRVFYIDIGNMPKAAGEQYVRAMMNKYTKKIVYDGATGEVDNENRHMNILEDFWLPRRGDKGTQIDTLAGGQNLGEIEDILYFQKKLYRSLNLPITRLESENSLSFGRAEGITRDELNFGKFVERLRMRFSGVFDQFLKQQLILKKIITPEDWDKIKENLLYDFLEDSYLSETKELEVLKTRLEIVQELNSQELVGKYYSHDYLRKFVLRQTEDMIKEQDKLIKNEEKDPKYKKDEDDFGGGGGFGGGSDEEEEPDVGREPESEGQPPQKEPEGDSGVKE